MKMCPWMSSLWWKWSHANCVYPDECVETDYSSARGGANTQFCQWHLNAQLHFFLFFFVVGFLKGKGRKAYNLGNSRSEMEQAVIQTRFGEKGLELWIHSRGSPTIACNLFFRTRFLDAHDNKYPRIPQPGHSLDTAHVFTRGHKHILFGNRQETQTHETRVS